MNHWNELSEDDRLRARIQGHPNYVGVFPVLLGDELVGWEANTQINQFIKGGKSLGIFYWPVDAAVAWNYWEAYHNADTPLKVSRGAQRGLLLNDIRGGWTHD